MKLLLLFFLTIASVLGQSPPSGGGQFFVPARFYRQPPPSTRYGPPLPPPPSSTTTTTTSTTTTTTEAPATTTEEDVDVSGGAVSIANAQSGGGVYYVLQPDGRLQRIAYAHGPAPASVQLSSSQRQQPGYLARFHYRDLEPLGAPIFSYSTPELVRLNK